MTILGFILEAHTNVYKRNTPSIIVTHYEDEGVIVEAYKCNNSALLVKLYAFHGDVKIFCHIGIFKLKRYTKNTGRQKKANVACNKNAFW